MKKMNWILVGLALALCVSQVGAVSVTRTKKSLISTKDANGYPVVLESDKGWRVFEVVNTTTETQVSDENGVNAVQGILHKVCVESRPVDTSPATYYAIIWDSAAATGGASVTGRKLLPAIIRASEAEKCVEINAVFTLGLRVLNGVASGSTFVYWRGLGDSR
jgi:hypothetical protein